MTNKFTRPAGSIDMVFRPSEELDHVGDPIEQDVSSLGAIGRTVFCTCDETATVERLVHDEESGELAAHEGFALGRIFDLPAGIDGEMDIEGLAISDGYLWVTGSHSLKRGKPETGGELEGLGEIEWDANRGFLGRVPLLDRGDGIHEPVGAIETFCAEAARTAACVKMDGKGRTILREMLAADPLIAPFMDIPCKENGFDIEGLAVDGDRVWLGLRGPVIGGHAFIIELRMKETKGGHLKPRKIDGGKRYRLHAVDLDGQGVRDLLFAGGGLYILSGATTDLEALQSVYHLKSWPPEETLVPRDRLKRIIDLPAHRGSDHAEGIAIFRLGGKDRMLVAYDSPRDERVSRREPRLTADLFAL